MRNGIISKTFDIHSFCVIYRLLSFSCSAELLAFHGKNTPSSNSAIIQIDLKFAREKDVSNSFKINCNIVNNFFEHREIGLSSKIEMFRFWGLCRNDPDNLIRQLIQYLYLMGKSLNILSFLFLNYI